MRVGRRAGATAVLLLAERPDHDGVLDGSNAVGRQWLHVEDINALHLSENFKTLETSGLLQIGCDSTRLCALGKEVGVGLDV